MEKKLAAGVAILFENKILLVHPTKAKWVHSYSIPKGLCESNESSLIAAFRELKEETSIDLKPISHTSFKVQNKNKELISFILRIQSLEEINLKELKLDKTKLQLSEVDWAGFVEFKEAMDKRLVDYQKELLQFVIDHAL